MKPVIALIMVIVWAVAPASAVAQKAGSTVSGAGYLSGGASKDERDAMQSERGNYSLVVQTAAKSGAFLATANVKIADRSGNTVFDQQIDGPWLFVNLPAGPYTVAVTFKGRTQAKPMTIQAGSRRDMMFYFDDGD